MLFQIDPSTAKEIALEIAKNIPKPQQGVETWIYGLFALAGWAVAVGLMYVWTNERKELGTTMTELNNTMIATKVYLEGRAVQDQRIEDLKDRIIRIQEKIEAFINSVKNKI